MAGKIAQAGLNYNHLKFAFDRKGIDGLSSVLGEKNQSCSTSNKAWTSYTMDI